MGAGAVAPLVECLPNVHKSHHVILSTALTWTWWQTAVHIYKPSTWEVKAGRVTLLLYSQLYSKLKTNRAAKDLISVIFKKSH